MKIRKQVNDLTLEDLERFPVWEFALDEEGLPGQDETTVRPLADLNVADARMGLGVVKTAFVAADGAEFGGFCTPSHEDELASIQPTVVTSKGHISFWWGILQPPIEEISRSYQVLGKPATALFPLQFRAAIPIECGFASGVIPGFCYFKKQSWWSKRPRQISTVT